MGDRKTPIPVHLPSPALGALWAWGQEENHQRNPRHNFCTSPSLQARGRGETPGQRARGRSSCFTGQWVPREGLDAAQGTVGAVSRATGTGQTGNTGDGSFFGFVSSGRIGLGFRLRTVKSQETVNTQGQELGTVDLAGCSKMAETWMLSEPNAGH